MKCDKHFLPPPSNKLQLQSSNLVNLNTAAIVLPCWNTNPSTVFTPVASRAEEAKQEERRILRSYQYRNKGCFLVA